MVIGVILIVLLVGFGIFQSAESTAFAAVNPLQQEINDADRNIIGIHRKINDAEARDAPEQLLQSLRAELDMQLTRKQGLLGILQSSQNNQRPGIDDTAVWASALSTKIGSVLLLLLLVQILASLYRYNMRLASFYDSRADYFQLQGTVSDSDKESLLALVGTEGIDIAATSSAFHELLRRVTPRKSLEDS